MRIIRGNEADNVQHRGKARQDKARQGKHLPCSLMVGQVDLLTLEPRNTCDVGSNERRSTAAGRTVIEFRHR